MTVQLIEPCISPFLDASAICALQDIGVVQVFVTDSCRFLNVTQHADYKGCSKTVNKGILADIATATAPTPSLEALKFCPNPKCLAFLS
jgi:hypothetical protein